MIKITMPTISPQSQKLIAGSLVLLTAFLSYDWILASQCQYLEASEHKSRFDTQLQEKVETVAAKNRLFEKKVNELKTYRQETGGRLFTQSEAEAFFSQLASMATECGCQIGSVSFHSLQNPPAGIDLPDAGSSTIQFRGALLKLFGSYESWIEFMKRLESPGRIVFLSRFSLRSGEGSDQRLEGEVELAAPILLDIPESLLNPPALETEEDELESEDDDADE